MIHLVFMGLTKLNDSLQVGDMVYATPSSPQAGASDSEANGVGGGLIVGVLSQVTKLAGGAGVRLDIDELGDGVPLSWYRPNPGDFIMFSKHSQTGGGVNGYFAKANFVNTSKEKAELFAVSSEVIINSK